MYIQNKKYKKTNKKRKIIVAVAAVVLALATLALLEFTGKTHFFRKNTDSATQEQEQKPVSSDTPGVNNAGEPENTTNIPSRESADPVEAAKERATTPTTNSTTTKKTVSITIVNAYSGAGKVTVGAIVSGVTENGGTCTFTFTGNGTKTTTTKGTANTSYTDCRLQNYSLPGSGWSVKVTYSSGTATGASTVQLVQ